MQNKKEIKSLKRSSEIDAFASESFFHFDESIGIYVSRDPFSGDKFVSLVEMKQMMADRGEKK